MDRRSYYRLCENLCWLFGPILGPKNEFFFNCVIYVGLGTCVIWWSERCSFWENFGFLEYFSFSGGKLGPNMDQNSKFWVRLVSPSRHNFKRLFIHCLCLIMFYPWSKFQKNWAWSGGKRAQKLPKWSISWILHHHKNIWNFITWEPQKL